jgi:hypothetical protein
MCGGKTFNKEGVVFKREFTFIVEFNNNNLKGTSFYNN